jgi:hypothetical protein
VAAFNPSPGLPTVPTATAILRFIESSLEPRSGAAECRQKFPGAIIAVQSGRRGAASRAKILPQKAQRPSTDDGRGRYQASFKMPRGLVHGR